MIDESLRRLSFVERLILLFFDLSFVLLRYGAAGGGGMLGNRARRCRRFRRCESVGFRLRTKVADRLILADVAHRREFLREQRC